MIGRWTMPKALLIRLRILWLALAASFQIRRRPTDCEDVAEMKTGNCRIPASHGALCSRLIKFGWIWGSNKQQVVPRPKTITRMYLRSESSQFAPKKATAPCSAWKVGWTGTDYIFNLACTQGLKSGWNYNLWFGSVPRLLHGVTLSDVRLRHSVTVGAPCNMQIDNEKNTHILR